MESTQENEIIIYQPDETLKLDVQVEGETVWLTQAQMMKLFQTTKQNISLHTNNIFKEGELDANSVVKYSLTTESSCNSPSCRIFLICKLIFCFEVSKSFAIASWAKNTLSPSS